MKSRSQGLFLSIYYSFYLFNFPWKPLSVFVLLLVVTGGRTSCLNKVYLKKAHHMPMMTVQEPKCFGPLKFNHKIFLYSIIGLQSGSRLYFTLTCLQSVCLCTAEVVPLLASSARQHCNCNCVRPAVDWRPAHGVSCLLPKVSWGWLQLFHDPD